MLKESNIVKVIMVQDDGQDMYYLAYAGTQMFKKDVHNLEIVEDK